eukprot:TRINITY_DN1140_c0_g1_i14.p1 TRINITY_DN1140_c0_g1~~TRINITY_DN1140_c0_g1_i14.p1  ORF type:complete len:132 (-),score=16.08 TRINITY_DN1140_c0_g1_i14:298-693(-)
MVCPPPYRSQRPLEAVVSTQSTGAEIMSIPPVRWCQRKDKILLKVDIADIERDTLVVSLKDQTLALTCIASGQNYALQIEFYKEVVEEGSKWYVHGKATEFSIQKKEPGSWPQLTKTKAKHQVRMVALDRH